MVDIFKEGTSMNMPFWTPVNVGDKVQGTYVDHFLGTDQYNNEQHLYVLKKEDGSLVKVAIKSYKTWMIDQMERIKMGQIIGFTFTAKQKTKSGRETNVIDIISNASIVDEQWLASQKRLSDVTPAPTRIVREVNHDDIPDEPDLSGKTVNEIFPDAVQPAEVQPAAKTDAEKIAEIAEIVKTKLGTTDASQVKDTVVMQTGLAFLPANLDAILEKLHSL